MNGQFSAALVSVMILIFSGMPAMADSSETWLDGFRPVDQANWPDGPGDDPLIRLNDLIRAGWEEEGRPTVSVAAVRDSDKVLVEIVKTGYADDSVDGERHHAIMVRGDNGWEIEGLAVQYRCGRGDNAGQWTQDLCP